MIKRSDKYFTHRVIKTRRCACKPAFFYKVANANKLVGKRINKLKEKARSKGESFSRHMNMVNNLKRKEEL